MPIVPANAILSAAKTGGYAVGYFEIWDMQSMEAVVAAAEAEHSPVVIGFGLMTADPDWKNGRAIAYYAAIAQAAGANARVPVSLIFNEVATLDQAKLGVDLGFNIVMLEGEADLGELSFVDGHKDLVKYAHARGAVVEAELGELPLAGEAHDASLTDPTEAAAFVAETGVDILAVSVGNVHCETGETSQIDLDTLSAIGKSVSIPLSLHGGSGLPAACIPPAIASGVVKVNVGTVLKKVHRDALVKACSAPDKLSDVQKCIGCGGPEDVLTIAAGAVTAKVRDYLRIYGSAGKA